MSVFKHEYGLIVYYVIIAILVLIMCSLGIYLCLRKCKRSKVSSNEEENNSNKPITTEDIRNESVNISIKNPYSTSCTSSQMTSVNGDVRYEYNETYQVYPQSQIYSPNMDCVYPEVIPSPVIENPYEDR